MFDVGGPELLVIVLGVLLLFGPKKIPEIAQMFGKGMQKIRNAQSQFKDQINEIQNDLNVVDTQAQKKSPPIKEINSSELKEENFDDSLAKDNSDNINNIENEKITYPDSKDFGFTPKEPSKPNS